jgi:hypothetical protein
MKTICDGTRGGTSGILAWVTVGACAGISGSLPAQDFLRGDVDASGRLAVNDATRILLHLFQGEADAVPCEDAADADDSGALDISDAAYLLASLFRSGAVPPPPFPLCGPDPTEDPLGCSDGCPPLTTYFGNEFRVDGLFFVIDRSGSVASSGAFHRAKQETERVISGLPPGLEFAVIFSAAGFSRFPASGVPAESTEEMKASGAAFVHDMSSGAGSCDRYALLAALDYAGKSHGTSRAIFYVTDGGGTCMGASEEQYLAETVETVTAANAGRARIHTFNVDASVSADTREQFLQDIAARNGGMYFPLR